MAIYIVVAVSVVFFFVLFLLVSMEARRNFKGCSAAIEQMQRDMEKLREEARAMAAARTEDAPPAPVEAPPQASASGMSINLTRRAQVLRMHRSGADAADIARKLGLPVGEVSLTLKMHKILLEQTLA
jgi:hypothetical protein